MWPIERQEKLLAERVPEWSKIEVYKDVLTPKQRQAHGSVLLIERAAMLRSTKPRSGGERIYLASMAPLAWDGPDLELALSGVWSRGATLIVLDVDAEIAPFDNATARELFKRSRKRASVEARSKAGALASAAIRRKPADEGVERIRERWGMPADLWPTSVLLAEAGEPGAPLAYNTVTARLGGRELAQKRYLAAQKRAVRRMTATVAGAV